MRFSTFVHDLMTLQAPEGQTRTAELRFLPTLFGTDAAGREGPTTQDKEECLMAATGHLFDDMTATCHPPGVAGGWQARSSNNQWAFRAGIPKRPLPNCQAGPTASSTPLLCDAQKPWGGHPSGQAHRLPPFGYCGSVATCPVQWWNVHKGGDPRTDQASKGADSKLPGWQPKENVT